jgi:hypothetical protein
MKIHKNPPLAPITETILPPSKNPSPLPAYVPPRQDTIPRAGQAAIRRTEMEISDTAENRCCPINYGIFRFSVPLVHADIVSGKLELIGLVGEGPIGGIDYVWVDEKQVYPSPPAWATCQLRLGTTTQTAVTNISNTTVKDWTHPGRAYVSIQLTLATAPIVGAIPRVEVQGRGIVCEDLGGGANPWAWTEDPIWHLADALKNADYGAGGSATDLDIAGFVAAAAECDEEITYESLASIGQQSSNQQLPLSDYDRLQSFKAPGSGFKVEVRIRAVAATGVAIGFPCCIRTTPDGANIVPDTLCDPVMPAAGADYTLWGTWVDIHGFTAGQTLYLVTLSAGVSSSAGPRDPGTGADDPAVGTLPWNNPGAITYGSHTYTDYAVSPTTTHYLKATDFGFSIPVGATITGIELGIKRWVDYDDDWGDWARDSRVRLVKGGTVQATDKASSDYWPNVEVEKSYGGQYDLWGSAWTPADVNATNFGAVLSADVAGPSLYPGNVANVSRMRITVYYTTPGGGPASNMKWHHNSLTDGYADGKAQYKSGTWVDQLYDHWFRASVAEQKYRCALTVLDRQSFEQLAQTILQTCHGRLSWWDGLWRVTLDELAASTGTISDDPADTPDIPIIAGSLVCSHDDRERPNTGVGTYLAVDDWTRKEVRYEDAVIQAGTEQPKELRQDGAAVPSGGQMFRLLSTWVRRARRTWRASCRVPQHGLTKAPGDLLTLLSRLFTGTKTVLIEDITDAPDGSFTFSLVEYAAADFSILPYIAQPIVPTTTTT